jgi:hypothetical protein
MDVSPALLVDRVLQTRNNQTTQDVQISVLKKAMDMQESASAALLNAVAGNLPLASGGYAGEHAGVKTARGSQRCGLRAVIPPPPSFAMLARLCNTSR